MRFRRRFAVLVAFSVLFVILGAACSPLQVPPEPSPAPPSASLPQTPSTPSAPQPAEWSADGVITAGEYAGVQTFGDYEIQWTSDGNYIYIGMKAKTSGWLAVGIQPGTRMKDADMVLGFVKDDKATIYDFFCTGDYGPHSPDTELGGANDILEFGGKEAGGYTTIEFKRLLDTGDKYDISIFKGANKIIWSYGLDDQSTQKHVSRGYGEIEL